MEREAAIFYEKLTGQGYFRRRECQDTKRHSPALPENLLDDIIKCGILYNNFTKRVRAFIEQGVAMLITFIPQVSLK